MTGNKFTSIRLTDDKQKKVIVNICGDIINRNPTKYELKDTTKHLSTKEILKLPEDEMKKYLLEFLIYFYEKERRTPLAKDFTKNPKYPSFATYQRVFENWNNAIIEAELWNKRYNPTHTCDRCGISFDKTTGHPTREKDKYGKWLLIWDCNNCYQKYDPNSNNSKTKQEADCRNGNLDPNSNTGIGYVAAVLIKKYLEVEDCFELTDNFNYPEYDMIEHKDWGKIDVKGSSLLTENGYLCHSFCTNKNKTADFFFCVGFDKDRKRVLAVFIIPNEEYVSKLDKITVPYNRRSKYNKYKESEEDLKKWDDLFHTMKLDNCPVLRKKKKNQMKNALVTDMRFY